jgi:hypothetical protein
MTRQRAEELVASIASNQRQADTHYQRGCLDMGRAALARAHAALAELSAAAGYHVELARLGP